MLAIAWQACKSVLGTAAGTLLGLFCRWQFEYAMGWIIFLCVTGGLVGFALTLPGVSVWRVLGGTAAAIVGYNAGERLGRKVYRSIAGDCEPPAPAPSMPSEPVPADAAGRSPFADPPAESAVSPAGDPEEDEGAWVWGIGIACVTVTVLCAALSSVRKTEDSTPQASKEHLADQMRIATGLDPAVVYPAAAPKLGEPDTVGPQLEARLAALRGERPYNPTAVGRLEKSLAYWQERRRRATESLPSHPPLTITIPQGKAP
jgi:hypothetical protein